MVTNPCTIHTLNLDLSVSSWIHSWNSYWGQILGVRRQLVFQLVLSEYTCLAVPKPVESSSGNTVKLANKFLHDGSYWPIIWESLVDYYELWELLSEWRWFVWCKQQTFVQSPHKEPLRNCPNQDLSSQNQLKDTINGNIVANLKEELKLIKLVNHRNSNWENCAYRQLSVCICCISGKWFGWYSTHGE